MLTSVFLIAIVVVTVIGMGVPSVFAETWYYYVEPLPEYASYANNVMELSTTAWEDVNDDLEFIEVTSPEQANFQVQWVKEFGVEHVGYAYGSWFIEVGLGDSNCGTGMWQPYSEKYTTDIMTHEIGHVLGWDHVDDPDSIMYPVALNWEYGIVETSKTLTNDYGYFSPICTSKDSTTFNWHVSSDDPTYGFDVYFVPSIDEFDSWVEDGTFSYFDDTGCFAENMISVGGTCEGVTSESGLLVLMGDKATEPLTEITLAVQENNLGYDINSNDVTKGSSILNPADSIDIDRTFTLYADPQQEFSVNYPSNWLINKDGEFLLFSDDYNWTAQIQIADFSEGIDGEFDIDNAMDGITTYVQESCENATIEKDGHVCYDFQLQTSAQKFNFPSHETVYFIEYSDTQQYDLISGHKETMKTILTLIYNDSKVWLLVFNVDSNVSEEYFDVFFEIVSSFKIIKSGEESSTTKSSATPIPTPQPEVITSVGSAVLSKTSVDVGYEQSEQVKVYGTINNVNKSTRVNITYTYPDGTTNGVQVFTTDSGVYETVLDLDTNSPKGVYEILVTSKNKVIGILELEVVEKKLEAPPSPKVVATDTEKDPIESPTILEKPKFSFVDESKDPWSYVDRYPNEASYKEWFDENYPDYTIYEAVNLKNPLDFVDNSKDPQSYVDRYNNEESYKKWFDDNYSQYSSIYEAVGLEEPEFASFIDATKDPRTYLVRYYTEPEYQKWFDTNFPNISIEDAVDYPYKIITDEYYVNYLFDFVIKKPVNLDSMEELANTFNEDVMSLVEFNFGGNGKWGSVFNVHFYQNNDIDYDNLLDSFSNYPSDSNPYAQQIKINDQTVKQNNEGRYEIRYDYVTITEIPDDVIFGDIRGSTLSNAMSTVIFLYPNGDQYQLILTSYPESYSNDVQIFNESVDSFYVGKTKNLSEIIGTNISNNHSIEKSNDQSIPESIVKFTPEPIAEITSTPNCGFGTELVNGICQIIPTDNKTKESGGCLIATAAYGSELSPQVQLLREIRDNQLLNTEAGSAFMNTFNDVYYSFSPTIADMQRESPLFKEAVKISLTPMLSSLAIMENAESESEVISLGLSVIALNLGIYLGIPAMVGMGIRKHKII